MSAAEPPDTSGRTGTGECSRRRSGAPPGASASATENVARSRPRDWQLALAPWLVARGVVAAGFAIALGLFDQYGRGTRPASFLRGLLTYDADFYRAIAEHGYARHGGSLRFFPLVPLFARVLGRPFGDHTDVALLVVANAAAFGFLVVLAKVTRLETNDERVVRAAVWLGAVAPPAVALVLGYAESTFMLLAVGTFWCLRTHRPGAAAPLGFLAGLCRPFGLFLVAPALIEVARGWRAASASARAWGVAAVLAPAGGVATYLVWSGVAYDDAFLPMRIQQASHLRGGFRDPVSAVADAIGNGLDRPTALLHVGAAIGCIALLIVVARRLPASYAVFAGISLLLAVSAENLDSLERYALGAFPLLIGAASCMRRLVVMRVVVGLSIAGLLATSIAVFLGRWVP